MVGSQIWLVQIDSSVPRQNSSPTKVLKRSSRVKSWAGTKRMNCLSCSLAWPPAAATAARRSRTAWKCAGSAMLRRMNSSNRAGATPTKKT